jgi:hypothetical protein
MRFLGNGLKREEFVTTLDWRQSSAPQPMLDWLAKQGRDGELFDFTLACFHRIWDELPGEVFRRVVKHAERVGMRDIDDVLDDARRALDKLNRVFHEAGDLDQTRLSRQIGFGQMVRV